MNTLSYRTSHTRPEDVVRKWFVIDAENLVLGRMSSHIASILRGKHRPDYTPHVDCGDYIIVINAEKVRFTGKKLDDKTYLTYSGYPGGQKSATPRELLARIPTRVVETAVRKMLPKNKLGDAMYKKLFVYAGSEHFHQAQKPEVINL
ncbi:MAG: 50S ribosomal protein L13 [Saprospiraceae bacterium]|uniref:Large ribosomal subunit protein uL13 n=1 Tax=Candidatus Defluviibacterium haderslevense TaxID=2981993 RepID=A0A9D7S819_9BACT|nr:50S ribosomal protein L13 [Candidatus Defluviibacterium haderslevense]MCC7026377.1 50S ribosomal protein L13 [Saprospiraceae bacterium]MBK7245648.1 50S ribosomal protein L13 [Candidatus Defluviibacterium haderslevense]MBK8241937.1 50S ribosomal protein L13 [Candidatus Defluviibacterium haderslevense]MBK9717483.1 50S ribosomal protein L13 [Candidatus Defluviibacterium haderslevense]